MAWCVPSRTQCDHTRRELPVNLAMGKSGGPQSGEASLPLLRDAGRATVAKPTFTGKTTCVVCVIPRPARPANDRARCVVQMSGKSWQDDTETANYRGFDALPQLQHGQSCRQRVLRELRWPVDADMHSLWPRKSFESSLLQLLWCALGRSRGGAEARHGYVRRRGRLD
jgi:hypothetical protein